MIMIKYKYLIQNIRMEQRELTVIYITILSYSAIGMLLKSKAAQPKTIYRQYNTARDPEIYFSSCMFESFSTVRETSISWVIFPYFKYNLQVQNMSK